MLRRPIVLTSIISFIEIFLILAFPQYFIHILAGSLLFSGVCILFCSKKKRVVVIILLVSAVIISAASSYFSYVRYEKKAVNLLGSWQDKKDTQYTAVVDECKVYSSYSQIFATITSVDGIPVSTPLKASLGCYSGYQLDEGDNVVFSGNPISVFELDNNDFDTTSYLRSKEIFIDFPSVTITESSPSSEGIPLLSRLRKYTKDIIFRYIPQHYNFDTAAVSYAMFAGDRHLIPADIKETFSVCGLSHILCVSGMHLAVLAGICFSILSLFTVHKRIKCIVIIALCIFYTAFTGFSLSTIRACIMCILSYIGMMSGRKTDAYISLFFSLLLICIFSPYSVLDISLILSFCATLGIICLLDFAPTYKGQNSILKILVGVLNIVLANLGAVIFTLPVCAVSFGGISLMSIVSTMAVSFIFEILLLCLLFLILLSSLSFLAAFDFLLEFVGTLCNLFCTAIINVAEFFSLFRYASVTTAFSEIFAILFVSSLVILSVFIAFDLIFARRLCIAFIVTLGVVFSVISLMYSIADDNIYKVTYYRKNENDRQLSIKLATYGFLLVNADNNLCTDKDDAPFDYRYGNNYLLIIPDDVIIPSVLAKNIEAFDKRFGIKYIYVPKTKNAKELAYKLSEYGIECYYLPFESNVGDIIINYKLNENFYLSTDDGKTKTGILFGNTYDKEQFEKDCDICAFFTRKTKNQFDLTKDTKPVCNEFFTRLKKEEASDGIVNTFGEKTIVIKG